MIISRAPVRISIGGGGTDLPFFYPKFGGDLITSSINRYIYVTVSERQFYNEFRITYSKTENIEKVDEIENDRVRESLKLLNINTPLEISVVSEVPGKSGLGSSSCFLIALLKALHTYKKESVSDKTLAEEACKIEIGILKEPIGKQDQYASSYGGLNHLSISRTGQANLSPLNLSHETIRGLEENLYLFYTNIQRNAKEVIEDQSNNILNDNDKMNLMLEIKKIGNEIKKSLESGNLRRFGKWLNIHWETKKRMSGKMSNSEINKWYELALSKGALGGKIIGAGGGGFLLFYYEKGGQDFIKKMKEKGLKYIPFRFDFDGCKILFDGK